MTTTDLTLQFFYWAQSAFKITKKNEKRRHFGSLIGYKLIEIKRKFSTVRVTVVERRPLKYFFLNNILIIILYFGHMKYP